MVNRLIDLVVLVAELSQQSGKSLKDLDKELVHRGYSSEEIEQALFWMSSQWRPADTAFDGGSGRPACRVLSPWESMSLDTEAYGYLLRLQNLGIIDPERFERIMRRIHPYGDEWIPLGELKALVGSVVFNLGEEQTEDEVLDGLDEEGHLT
jgi:Smg protein